jgi:hypothetical protein
MWPWLQPRHHGLDSCSHDHPVGSPVSVRCLVGLLETKITGDVGTLWTGLTAEKKQKQWEVERLLVERSKNKALEDQKLEEQGDTFKSEAQKSSPTASKGRYA